MPHPYHLQIWNKNDELTGELKGEFLDGDWTLLKQFKGEAQKLFQCGPVKNGINVEFKVRWDANKGMRIYGALPSNDDVAILLHRLRPFVLQNEKTNFMRISGILNRYFDHPNVRSVINRRKDLFSGKDFQQHVVISVDEMIINSENILYKYLMAFEYHRDEDKKKEIEMIHQLLPAEGAKAIFISMMIDKVKAIEGIYKVILNLENRDGKKYRYQ